MGQRTVRWSDGFDSNYRSGMKMEMEIKAKVRGEGRTLAFGFFNISHIIYDFEDARKSERAVCLFV